MAAVVVIYYIQLKSHLSVRLSITQQCLYQSKWDLHAQCESCAFGEHRVYFYKPKEPTAHRQERIKDEAINQV